MERSPLRSLSGYRPSALMLGIAAGLLLIIGNIIFAVKTDYGSSFYSYWLSGRVLLAQGENPYDDSLFEQVRQKYPEDKNVSGFVLPLYAVLPVIPFAFIDQFKVALVLWRLLLEAALIFTGIRLVQAFHFQNRYTQQIFCASVLLLSYYGIAAVIDGEISILAILFFIIGMAALQNGETELSGIMFAFSTIKSSLTLLPLLWVCIWCLFHHRGTIFVWTGMVLILLVMTALLFQTDWFMKYLRSIVYYLKYMNPTNFSKLFENWQPELGGRIGWAISIVLLLLMLLEWGVNAKKGENALEWVLALTFCVGFLVGLPNLGKHLFILWIPSVYMMDKMIQRWEKKGVLYSLIWVILCMFLPWLLQLLVYPDWLNPVNQVNLAGPFILLALLYWNRWWVIDTFIEKY